MTILGIDTSSTDLSVCLYDGGSPVSTVNRYAGNSHAEHITRAVETALELGGKAAEDVTRVAVSVGPGSFTGLRIGLSFVKGFCLMAERLVMPLSSLYILAHAACGRMAAAGGYQRKIFTALDARQGRVHWGGFVWNEGGLSRLSDDRLSPPEELIAELSPDDILVADTVGYSRSAVFNMFEGKAEIIRAENAALNRGLSCAALADLAGNGLWQTADAAVPNYLQMPAAQEKLCS